nr:MAG TPA: hypothetical protein [Caudoviricetes sp.]
MTNPNNIAVLIDCVAAHYYIRFVLSTNHQ